GSGWAASLGVEGSTRTVGGDGDRRGAARRRLEPDRSRATSRAAPSYATAQDQGARHQEARLCHDSSQRRLTLYSPRAHGALHGYAASVYRNSKLVATAALALSAYAATGCDDESASTSPGASAMPSGAGSAASTSTTGVGGAGGQSTGSGGGGGPVDDGVPY